MECVVSGGGGSAGQLISRDRQLAAQRSSSFCGEILRACEAAMAGRGKLIAVIGDEDTCTGFLLGGIGELNKNRKPNFLVVEKDTSITEIEETFK